MPGAVVFRVYSCLTVRQKPLKFFRQRMRQCENTQSHGIYQREIHGDDFGSRGFVFTSPRQVSVSPSLSGAPSELRSSVAFRSINIYPCRVLDCDIQRRTIRNTARVFTRVFPCNIRFSPTGRNAGWICRGSNSREGYREDVKRIIYASSIAVFR